uniref:Bm10954, isoform c n=1 Tax=Brugia malayi TaxID=6279 RepID=A0A1I9G2H4_BRUMA|nr:Bm10954, isoform c [Brugia malayi]
MTHMCLQVWKGSDNNNSNNNDNNNHNSNNNNNGNNDIGLHTRQVHLQSMKRQAAHGSTHAEKGRKSAECDMAYMCVLSAGLLLPTTRKTHRGGAILSAEKRNARNLAEGSTGKEKGTFGVACIEERTGVNSVKNSIHEVGRVLMVWRGREAVGAGRTTKWALLSTFHPYYSLPDKSWLNRDLAKFPQQTTCIIDKSSLAQGQS